MRAMEAAPDRSPTRHSTDDCWEAPVCPALAMSSSSEVAGEAFLNLVESSRNGGPEPPGVPSAASHPKQANASFVEPRPSGRRNRP